MWKKFDYETVIWCSYINNNDNKISELLIAIEYMQSKIMGIEGDIFMDVFYVYAWECVWLIMYCYKILFETVFA